MQNFYILLYAKAKGRERHIYIFTSETGFTERGSDLQEGGRQMDEAGLNSVVCSNRRSGKDLKREYRKFCNNM